MNGCNRCLDTFFRWYHCSRNRLGLTGLDGYKPEKEPTGIVAEELEEGKSIASVPRVGRASPTWLDKLPSW
jgi:hypothetical protein